jgi:hypothetical protein
MAGVVVASSSVKDVKNFTDSTNFLMYCTTVILQIVSFVFLFKYKSLEYIISIYSFILYAFSPLFLLDKLMENMSRMYLITTFKLFCLFVSYFFAVSGLFIVLLTNEKTRKLHVEYRTTENPASIYYKKSILTLFVIILPLTWFLQGDIIFLSQYAEGIQFVRPTFDILSVLNFLYLLTGVLAGIVITVTSLVLFVKSYKNYKIVARKQKTDV